MNAPTNQFPDLPETFDLNELKGVFSDEEIAALAEGDDPIVKMEEPTKPADPGLADEDAAALAAAQSAQQAAQQAQQSQAQPEPAKAADEPPPVEIPDTTAADAVIKSFDAKLEEIQQKYDDGDMTRAEMNAAVKAASAELAEAQSTIDRATQLIQDQQQQAEAKWLGALDTFKAAGNEALWSEAHVKGFDAELRRVTDTRIHPEFAGKPFDFLIRTAAARYATAYEQLTGQKVQATTPQPKAQGQQQQNPTPPKRPDAPQLLSGLNGDGGMSVDDGTFAAIDRTADTDPFAAEKMISKLSGEALENYLRGN